MKAQRIRRNKIYLLLLSIVMPSLLFGQFFSERIREDIDRGVLSEIDGKYIEALRILNPEKLPEAYKDLIKQPVKSGFHAAYWIRSQWEQFTTEQQEVLSVFLYRPTLPDSYITPSTFFKIHYTTVGINAVSTDDLDGSGIPDYVEEVAASMDHVYSVEVDQLGLNPPPDDLNVDGPEWDVYIRNLAPGVYGITWFDERISQNPEVWTSYLEVENDYAFTYTTGINGMRVTTAHEFFHMIQLGYNYRDDDLFLMEGGSTWMEDVCYDYINDYLYFLTAFFSATNVPFDDASLQYQYGLCIWFHFLEKRLGNQTFVADLWDEILTYEGIDALERMLRSYNTTFDEELNLFHGWNYLTGTRADTVLSYPEGDTYPMYLNATLDGVFPLPADTTFSDSVRNTAAKYYQFEGSDNSMITLIPTNLNRGNTWFYSPFSLSLLQGSHNSYIPITDGVQARLVADDYIKWKCVGIYISPTGDAAIVSFNGSEMNQSGEDLPDCMPNPFIVKQHGLTTIPYVIDSSGKVTLAIFTASGYPVFQQDAYKQAGTWFFQWNGCNVSGEPVAGGIYPYVLILKDEVIRMGKIAVVR